MKDKMSYDIFLPFECPAIYQISKDFPRPPALTEENSRGRKWKKITSSWCGIPTTNIETNHIQNSRNKICIYTYTKRFSTLSPTRNTTCQSIHHFEINP
jgi:hypothetical protein